MSQRVLLQDFVHTQRSVETAKEFPLLIRDQDIVHTKEEALKLAKRGFKYVRYKHELQMHLWEHKDDYPLLFEKASLGMPFTTHNDILVTDEELKERERLANFIFECRRSAYALLLTRLIWKTEEKIEIESAQAEDSLTGLYILARCSDEGAFLELVKIDPTFIQDWYFQQTIYHMRSGDDVLSDWCGSEEQRQSFMKAFAEAVTSPYDVIFKPGKKHSPSDSERYLELMRLGEDRVKNPVSVIAGERGVTERAVYDKLNNDRYFDLKKALTDLSRQKTSNSDEAFKMLKAGITREMLFHYFR